MIQNRGPKGVWAALGRLLGGPWLLGISGQPPGRLLGSSWAVLDASWAPFGWLLDRLGHQVGASWGVLEASWRRLGRIFAPKWSQVGIKICQIIDFMVKLFKG